MSFDYIGAKKAGFTDEQISQHTGFDIAGARKANFTDEQISQHLANKTSNNQPQQEQESFIQSQKIPNIGQFLAGAAGSIFGKPGRVAAGTIGRAAGEATRQGLEEFVPNMQVVGQSFKRILQQATGQEQSPYTVEDRFLPGTPENRQRSLENVKKLAGETGVGLAGESFGEYALGPLIGKVAEGVTSPLTSSIIRKTGSGVRNLPGIKTVSDLLETTAKAGVRRFKNKAEIAAETLLSPSEKLSKKAPNLAKNFVKDVQREFKTKSGKVLKITGETNKEIYGNVKKILKNVGSDIGEKMKQSKEVLDFSGIKEKLLKEIKTVERIEENGKIYKGYKKQIDFYLKKTKKGMTKAWEDAVKFDDLTRTNSGDPTRTADFGTGKKMAMLDLSREIRNKLRDKSDEATKRLFKDYGNFSNYEKTISAKGEKVVSVRGIGDLLGLLKQPGLLLKRTKPSNLNISKIKFPNVDLSGVITAGSGAVNSFRDPVLSQQSSNKISALQRYQKQQSGSSQQ